VTLDRCGHLFPSLDATLADGLEATCRSSLRTRDDATSGSAVVASIL